LEKHIGMAFQLVDDMLDFTSPADVLGKPASNDINLGIATAPVLFAAAEFPQMWSVIERNFSKPGDKDLTIKYVFDSKGLPKTRNLAQHHVKMSKAAISKLPESPAKNALDTFSDFILKRTN